MSVHIQDDHASIKMEDLRSGHTPGHRNPPWQLQSGFTSELEQFINRKGMSAESFQLDGRIALDDDDREIPVTVKAVERHPGMFLFFAYPHDEDSWLVAEDPDACTD